MDVQACQWICWWPEAETDSADNLCRTCVFFTQVNKTLMFSAHLPDIGEAVTVTVLACHKCFRNFCYAEMRRVKKVRTLPMNASALGFMMFLQKSIFERQWNKSLSILPHILYIPVLNIKVTAMSGRLKSTATLLSKQRLFKVYVFVTNAWKK